MKKLILKTAFITLGATIIVIVAVFGLMSLWAPAVMMNLTNSLGMTRISGDYAYQEYERSGDLNYLAYSFIYASDVQDDTNADARFEMLYGHEGFEEFCASKDSLSLTEQTTLTYRNYILGQEACVQYRLAKTEEEKEAVCKFAIDETDPAFPAGNPVVALATEAASNQDKEFCSLFTEKLLDSRLNSEQLREDKLNDFIYILTVLMKTGGNV